MENVLIFFNVVEEIFGDNLGDRLRRPLVKNDGSKDQKIWTTH